MTRGRSKLLIVAFVHLTLRRLLELVMQLLRDPDASALTAC
jgi:hypothetical protein